MIRIDNIVGTVSDPKIKGAVHRLAHEGRVEFVHIAPADLERRRLLAKSDSGAEVAIALPRDQKLTDGAILHLDGTKAIVVRAEPERWLRVRVQSPADGLALGYCAGNMHWRVRFDGGDLLIALNNPTETYLARIEPLLSDGRAVVMGEEGSE